MRTQMMIMTIVAAILFAGITIVAALVWWLGWLSGLGIALGTLVTILGVYVKFIKPWHMRWGTIDDEATMIMPGDELIPDAGSATRAITIKAAPAEIWPWLVQLGYGKAGWYSYDWIDNDFHRSADRIVPEFQDLHVGDKILMMPGMGFIVQSIDEPHSIVSMLEDRSTAWCLALYPTENGGTRLVSRWHPKFDITPASLLMIALAEPGAFIMEQKMLRTIRDRVESTHAKAA